MAKKVSNTESEVRESVASLYNSLLDKRRQQYEEREAKREEERQQHIQEEEEKLVNEPKMSKKEKREAELDSWKTVIIGLTGDDLEYTDNEKKSKKKKYRKWIDDDDNIVSMMNAKPKKVKKKNYHKEFEPELNMLKAIVADQNRFTNDLQRRFQNAAGPATKDAMPLNKTLVELASAVNASRSNSLGLLREIGGIKKTIADLYMKQKKLDADLGGGSTTTTDLGLMGSGIAASLFADQPAVNSTPIANDIFSQQNTSTYQSAPVSPIQPSTPVSNVTSFPQQQMQPIVSEFNPDDWDGPSLPNNATMFENIPHSVVVEWHKNEDRARFKAVRNDNGEELIGCPVPTTDPSKLKFNEKDLIVKGEFDETYKLEII